MDDRKKISIFALLNLQLNIDESAIVCLKVKWNLSKAKINNTEKSSLILMIVIIISISVRYCSLA